MKQQIYGLAPVLEALRAGRRPIRKILIAATANQPRLLELTEAAQSAGIPLERRRRRELDELTGKANHQGVIALLAPVEQANPYVESESILEAFADLDAFPEMHHLPLVVLLDGIEDPHNLGAILRSCEGAGVDGVFIPEHRAAGLNETVAKTSAGAVEYVRVARVTNLVPLIDRLKDIGLRVIGVEGGSATVYTQFDMNVPLALVFGGEGKGIRRLVREKCDQIISIPLHGTLTSLNVSVAAGVVLFEAVRQRETRAGRSE
ncbi:MAG: 23S rRNA (guanosine(2251)-2'-O)-methyltransferase RlmB [Blastocatellia bacterium]|nr:23S rRNA (guanosine(2251)-2'-O)-methyltransferase RlmB [Blastocatellia bacterium]